MIFPSLYLLNHHRPAPVGSASPSGPLGQSRRKSAGLKRSPVPNRAGALPSLQTKRFPLGVQMEALRQKQAARPEALQNGAAGQSKRSASLWRSAWHCWINKGSSEALRPFLSFPIEALRSTGLDKPKRFPRPQKKPSGGPGFFWLGEKGATGQSAR